MLSVVNSIPHSYAYAVSTLLILPTLQTPTTMIFYYKIILLA